MKIFFNKSNISNSLNEKDFSGYTKCPKVESNDINVFVNGSKMLKDYKMV